VIYGLYQSAAGMLVNQYRLDVTANNLANVDTAGFKRDVASFSERLVESRVRLGAARHPVLDDMTGGVWSARTVTDWSTGSADVTGNPLDVMIAGKGFFTVSSPDGIRYTRAGQFTIDSQNRLVTIGDGYPVLAEGGTEIRLPEDATNIRITIDGKVVANDQVVGQLQVVEFDDPAATRKVGKGLVEAESKGRPVQPQLRVGAVERSNVYAMTELASMIEASRAYQLNAQMITMQDGTLGRLISEVARPIG